MFYVKHKSKNNLLKLGRFARILASVLLLANLSAPLVLAKPVDAPPSKGSGATAGDTNTTPGCAAGATPNANDNCTCTNGTPNSDSGCPDPAVTCTSNQCDLIAKYVSPTITVLAAVFGTVAVISIIIGGINFSASEGDPQKAARAKSRIVNTIFAIVAFLFLYAFLQFLIPGGLFNK